MKLALIGATGMVGRVMLKVLEERNFPISQLIPVASEKSVGNSVQFCGKSYPIQTLDQALATSPEIAIFSAGGGVSLEWAPKFAARGTRVIDNSSAWRMTDAPLVVPEVNAHSIKETDKIIANPNCSTIQMVVALAPLHKKYGIKRLVISTYQSVTGTGVKAMAQLEAERAGTDADMVYPHPIDMNLLPHAGDFDKQGNTSEEIKLVNETRKIMSADQIAITATVVRVPVVGGHSESVNIEFDQDFDLSELRLLLKEAAGVTVLDNPIENEYPMPKYAEGKDDVFVGRLRRDDSRANCLNMWIVSDNLRKGAATNAIQIAEFLVEKNWLRG